MKDIVGISKRKCFLVIALFFLCLACTTSTTDYTSYLKYLADSKNGLTREHSANGIKLRVKYLPVDYLVFNAVKSIDSSISANDLEKIKRSYKNSLTFMLTIGPAEGENFSITKIGVENYQQFAERIETMSFHMNEYITLEIKGKTIDPDLVQLETINTGEPSKNLIVVFKAIDEKGKSILNDDLTFVFDDELFFTGISKFTFKASDVNGLPRLTIPKGN